MASDRTPPLNRSFAAFLQVVIVLVGVGILGFLLWEPQVEGVNVHRTQSEIYFHDPFIAYVYLASIAVFTALYHAFKVLGFIRRNDVFSQSAVRSLRTIKWCGIALVAFVAGGEVVVLSHDSDDHAGGVAMGVFIGTAATIVAAAAATFEWVLRNAVEIKSEHDLTV